MYTTSTAYFSGALQHLEQRGIAPEDMLSAIEGNWIDLNDVNQRVPLACYENLLAVGETLLSDSLLGFHLGKDIRSADYGVLGYLAESCSTLEIAVEVLLQFDSLVADIGVAEVRKSEKTMQIRWTPKVETSKHVILRNMTAWVAIARKITRNSLVPERLILTVALSIEEQSILAQWFGCEVFVGQEHNALVFPSEFLQIPFDSSNPALFSTLTRLSESQLTTLGASLSYANRISQLLMAKPNLQNLELKTFASAFALSPRTLQRRLKNENTSFVSLLDQERKHRAKRLVTTTNLLEVATTLGFNDQSAFNKAFRRWFNQSPSEFISRTSSSH